MSWFTATSVTVAGGTTIVSVNAGDDIEIAQTAGGLIIGLNPPVEIKRTYLDGGGAKKIELVKAWNYPAQTDQPAVAFPTDGDLAAATLVLKQLIDGFAIASQIEAEDGLDNVKTMTPLRTKQAIDKQTNDLISNSATIAAMSQAQFEAIREQNKERYAASGWVSFGNHESGKQVNECKSGLYTALTTPNTLLIGKAGGVGGSKTDYASVHIDGVVFNLTNQFVLTLPSHPTSVLPERMDMYGVESEKVEISAASPNAYQDGLRGAGAAVNLFSATDQQKKDFFAQNSNTTYIGSDGKIYQWQLYKVAFAGATGEVPSPTEQGYSINSLGDLWLKAGKNLLYFGNVLRLNDGGYHPSFNPLGAAKFAGDTFWYNTATSITSRADCFNPSKLLAGSGSISSGKSGRPEIGGRYYDAIYVDGYGGVCRDMRYSAYRTLAEDLSQADLRVKNGTYRGFEERLFTKVNSGSVGGNTTSFGIYYADTAPATAEFVIVSISEEYVSGVAVGSVQHVYRVSDGTLLSGTVSSVVGTNIYLRRIGPDNPSWRYRAGDDTSGLKLVLSKNIHSITGGQFLIADVMGHPHDIQANPQLSNGWVGGWVTQLPTNVVAAFQLTRSALDTAVNVFYIPNSSSVWVNLPPQVINIVNNTYTMHPSAEAVAIFYYKAFSSQTEIAPNAALYGLLPHNVFASSDYRPENGALLGESLIGKVLKNNSGISVNNKSLLSCSTTGSGKLTSATNFDGVTHSPLTLGAPANNSLAFKVVSYLASINQQAVPHFAYTELRHNGTSFGDDGKQTIVDNQATKTDVNGNTVLVGTARLKEPIGWVKGRV